MLHDHKLCLRHNASNDPTRTTLVRVRWERDLVRRFQAIKKAIRKKIVTDNAFGIRTNASDFEFATKTEKVDAFMRWLRQQQKDNLLEVTQGTSVKSAAASSWQSLYIRSAYQKGMAMAGSQMRAGGVEVSDRWIDAGFYRPIHADAVGLLYIRAYNDLDGITKAMDTKISRALASGMANGDGMDAIADAIDDAVDKIGIVRARMLARTETIAAHADATLNSYEEAGIDGVEIVGEFVTAKENVCPECEELEGNEYSIQDARGVIPVHPNCRCAWVPIVIDPKGKKLL